MPRSRQRGVTSLGALLGPQKGAWSGAANGEAARRGARLVVQPGVRCEQQRATTRPVMVSLVFQHTAHYVTSKILNVRVGVFLHVQL